MPARARPTPVTDDGSARTSRISASRIVLVIAIAACLCLAMLALLQSLGNLRLSELVLSAWVLPALALHLLSLALFILAWQLLLKGHSGLAFRYPECLAHVGVTLTGKYLPGKIWGLLGRSYLLNRRGLSHCQLHLLVVDQFLTFYSGIIVIGIAGLITVSPLAAALAALAVAALSPWLLGTYPRLSGWLGRLAARRQQAAGAGANIGANESANKNADERSAEDAEVQSVANTQELKLQASIDTSGEPALQTDKLVRVTVVYILHWIGLGLALALLFYPALASDSFWLNSLLLVIAVPAGMLSGFLALWAPGGIGVREAVMVSILSINTSIELAAAIAIVYRLLCIGNDLLTGLFALQYFARKDPQLFSLQSSGAATSRNKPL
ncbi:MAG: lysylphosphatidylglycerol synthase domain-containing protein [Pseudohongiellaceae bacterium]